MSKNYEEMSDFEINKRIAIALRPFLFNYKCTEGTDGEACFTSDDDNRTFNYLKWVNYAWPIITENMISIEFDGEDKCDEPASWANAKSLLTCDVCMYQSNPLRAAMICFLKMKDAEIDHP